MAFTTALLAGKKVDTAKIPPLSSLLTAAPSMSYHSSASSSSSSSSPSYAASGATSSSSSSSSYAASGATTSNTIVLRRANNNRGLFTASLRGTLSFFFLWCSCWLVEEERSGQQKGKDKLQEAYLEALRKHEQQQEFYRKETERVMAQYQLYECPLCKMRPRTLFFLSCTCLGCCNHPSCIRELKRAPPQFPTQVLCPICKTPSNFIGIRLKYSPPSPPRATMTAATSNSLESVRLG